MLHKQASSLPGPHSHHCHTRQWKTQDLLVTFLDSPPWLPFLCLQGEAASRGGNTRKSLEDDVSMGKGRKSKTWWFPGEWGMRGGGWCLTPDLFGGASLTISYLEGQARLLNSIPDCKKESKKVKLLSCVRLFVTPWTVACQAPPSREFSRQEYWGLPNSRAQTWISFRWILDHLSHQLTIYCPSLFPLEKWRKRRRQIIFWVLYEWILINTIANVEYK